MNVGKSVLIWTILLVRCRTEDETTEYDQSTTELEKLKKIGQEYLRNVMNQLQNERTEGHPIELAELVSQEKSPGSLHDNDDYEPPPPTYNITGPTPVPPMRGQLVPSSAIPALEIPPGLTAGELMGMYNAAVTKLVNSPHLHTHVQPSSHIHHPPPLPPTASTQNTVVTPAAHGPAGASLPGYYYYYYPIKSFIKTYSNPTEMTTAPTTTTPMSVPLDATVTLADSSNKSVEPLFMAISSFIGMALIFVISVLFVPKFGKLRSGEVNMKDTSHELLALGRVVFDSMEGKDCAERLACEIGRILRGVNMDNKPLRILEIVLPPKMGKQISLVRKAAAKKQRCNSIPCKFKKKEVQQTKPTNEKLKRKPWKKAQSAHDLWMKHFENKTRFPQPENIWDQNRQRIRSRNRNQNHGDNSLERIPE